MISQGKIPNLNWQNMGKGFSSLCPFDQVCLKTGVLEITKFFKGNFAMTFKQLSTIKSSPRMI
jgi:hypothetical protein